MTTHVSSTTQSRGIGFIGLLTILFIGLKLTGFIKWSWWWVLSPLWIPATPALLLFLIWLVCTIGLALLKRHEMKKRVKAAKPKFISDLDTRR
jgi:hypothetical protein